MTKPKFYEWKENARGTWVPPEYVDICGGNNNAGLLLSQIVYWFLPSERDGPKKGKHKLTIFREGRWWLAKSKSEWWKEIRLKRDAFDNALELLENLGLVVSATHYFRKERTLHIWLNIAAWRVQIGPCRG